MRLDDKILANRDKIDKNKAETHIIISLGILALQK